MATASVRIASVAAWESEGACIKSWPWFPPQPKDLEQNSEAHDLPHSKEPAAAAAVCFRSTGLIPRIGGVHDEGEHCTLVGAMVEVNLMQEPRCSLGHRKQWPAAVAPSQG